MNRVIRSELIKLRTTRLWWGLLLGTVGLVALNVVPSAFFAGQDFGGGVPSLPPLDQIAGVTAVYGSGYQSGYLMVLVLGVIIGAGDRRHRTDTLTFLATPSRGRVIVAKMIVAALAGLLFGAVAELATVGAAAPVILARGADLSLGHPDVLRSLVLGVPGIALWGVIGVALGILLRNQVAAILVSVGYIFLGELLLSGGLSLANLDALVPYTPNNASTAIVGGFTAFPLLEWWGGVLVLLGYGVSIAVLGWLIGRNRDIG
jgi:ABC-2 type transport system permease protein